ncbi:MAG TPA: right-handed parallel beta-helix repeat-containing protein [Streptosporangiaceae bacterium]
MRRQLTRLLILALCAGALVIACSSFLPRFRVGLTGRAAGPVTYYVSPAGHDDAAGTSPATAWRTLRRASVAVLKPGDRLLLRARASYAGPLRLGPGDAGSAARPVRIGSYGDGRATVTSRGSGIVVTDTGGVTIADLTLRGDQATATGAGIDLFSNRTAGPRFGHVVIARVTASGFGNGIAVAAAHAVGFRDVRINEARLTGNINAGLAAFGPAPSRRTPVYAHADLLISHVTAAYNKGDPANRQVNSGNGIVLGSVAGARIAWSVAHGNGGNGAALHEGPFGIWAYDARGIVIDHNVAYGNGSNNVYDGGGFALDRNTSHCVLQYNLSYRNWGAGYQLYSSSQAAPSRDNTVRFNITSADSRTQHESGAVIINGYAQNSAVYQNTIVTASPPGPIHPAVYLGRAITGIVFLNNIFEGRVAAPLVLSAAALGRRDALLQGNDYFPAGPMWLVRWGPRAYLSLPGFRAGTGQETLNGQPTGSSADPRLTGPVLRLAVNGQGRWQAGANFDLAHGSPARGSGLNLRRLGVRPGIAGPGAARPNIGAR